MPPHRLISRNSWKGAGFRIWLAGREVSFEFRWSCEYRLSIIHDRSSVKRHCLHRTSIVSSLRLIDAAFSISAASPLRRRGDVTSFANKRNGATQQVEWVKFRANLLTIVVMSSSSNNAQQLEPVFQLDDAEINQFTCPLWSVYNVQ